MKRNPLSIALCLLCMLAFSGCAEESAGGGAASPAQSESGAAQESAAAIDTSGLFSERDLDGSYDESTAVAIQLNGDSAVCDSNAVSIDGTRITLTGEGVYLLSGTLTDGQIVVDAGENDKVQLVLSGVDMTSADSAAIYALEADKVFLTLADGTENTLSNGGEYIAIDENNIDAVVFAKTDLTLNGTGSLTLNAAAGHGVVSKDDLVITQGSYTVTAASHGLSGKDSVSIAGGSFAITAGKDGIHAENADDLSLGSLYIESGSFTIAAQGDAVSASGAAEIDDGTFTLDTVDDGLHTGGELLITDGAFTLSSGDDAIHADGALTIQNGSFTIPYCYEGIEGLSITVEGGTFNITSHDDGLNAAGGADSSGFGGRSPDQFSADGSDSFITINGGSFTIVSTGDCVDSNGDLTINGGTLDLTCNGSGNTALDADGTYANNDGEVTTNDGSENNPGQMGGGKGGFPPGGERPDRQPAAPPETDG